MITSNTPKQKSSSRVSKRFSLHKRYSQRPRADPGSELPTLAFTPGKGSEASPPSEDIQGGEQHSSSGSSLEKSRATDEQPEYPKGLRLASITIALCLSVFLTGLDDTIVSSAIPKITDEFQALDDVGWYGSAYLFTTCASQLFFGKLYTLYNIKHIYLVAIGLFELGSVVCGAAPNSTAFIIGRAVAGLGSAGIFSGGLIIIAYSVPLPKRPIYTGFVCATYGLSSVTGPLLGGAFTDHVSWRWCFYINLPVGVVTAIGIAFFHPPARKMTARTGLWNQVKQFDPLGSMFFVPGVTCLLLALQWGGSRYDWSSWRIIFLLVFSGALTICFIGVQIWKKNGTIPPRMFKHRSIAGASFFALCFSGSYLAFVYYLPLYFQAIKGVSATQSGIHILPMILGVVVASIIAGIAVSVLGYYTPFLYAASILMAVGAGLLTTLDTGTRLPIWFGFEVLYGVGLGLGMQQPFTTAQAVMTLDDVPVATAIMMFSQVLGGAVFISVTQNVFQNRLIAALSHTIPEFKDLGIVLRVGALDLKTAIPPQFIDEVQVAYASALTHAWYVPLSMACLSAVGSLSVKWVSVKGQTLTPVVPGVD